METPNILQALTNSDNPLIAMLSFATLILSGVVVYQWRYTMNHTVPKWLWNSMAEKQDEILDIQQKMNIIIDERLKK